jgi:hypothetical protein
MRRTITLGSGLLLLLASNALAQPVQPQAPPAPPVSLVPLYIVLGALVGLVAALLFYVWGLRDRTIQAANIGDPNGGNRNSLIAAFYGLPLGVPRGSIRGVLAIIIVFGSIAFLAISMLKGDAYKFPDALTGILGAILGFYFGKGNSDDGQAVQAVVAANADARDSQAKANEATARAQVAETQVGAVSQSLADVQAKHDDLASSHLDRITGNLQEAAAIGQTLSSLLPGNFGKTVGEAAGALSGTLATITELRKGDLADAVQQAGTLLTQATPNLPVVSVLTQAMQVMGPVLGTAVPPATFITTILGIGSKLSAAAYTRWVARIMDQPYTPEQFSSSVFDSNAAQGLLTQVPAMMQALGPQLQAGGSDVALEVVQLALTADGAASLATKFPEAFTGMAQATLDQAVRDLQKAALDFVLAKDLPPDAGASLGGNTALLQAIDKVRASPSASSGLDAVMTTVTALRQAGKNPATEFQAAADAIASQGATK